MSETAPRPKHAFPDWLWQTALFALGWAAATTAVQVIVQYTWYWLANVLFVLVPCTIILVLVLDIGVLCYLRRRPWSWRDIFVVVAAGLLFLPFVCLPIYVLLWLLLSF